MSITVRTLRVISCMHCFFCAAIFKVFAFVVFLKNFSSTASHRNVLDLKWLHIKAVFQMTNCFHWQYKNNSQISYPLYLMSQQTNIISWCKCKFGRCKFNLCAQLKYCIQHLRISTVSIQWVTEIKIVTSW